MGVGPSARVSRASKLSRQRQQVAAVCYRIRGNSLEFLLVQTRGGRWIFPKGGVEPGLTHAQSAALEAFEEAGVHGQIETIAFARYFRRTHDPASAKIITSSTARSSDAELEAELAVAAHLCEVTRLEPPQESNRNPSWFSADKAKRRLLKDRPPEFGAELVRVVDRASARIQRLHSAVHRTDRMPTDGLQKVRFEAYEDERLHDELRKAVLARYFLPRPALQLGTGETPSSEPGRVVTSIDSGRRSNLSQTANPAVEKRRVQKSEKPLRLL